MKSLDSDHLPRSSDGRTATYSPPGQAEVELRRAMATLSKDKR